MNPFGDAVIGFTATGEDKFPSAYAVVGDTVGGVTTFGPLLELKAGAATFQGLDSSGRNRWGDYSTTVLDPSNPYSFWTFQEFTQAKNQWAVQISQIVVSTAVPEPATLSILLAGILTMCSRRRATVSQLGTP